MSAPAPLVAVVMGSRSDWAVMRHAAAVLSELEVPPRNASTPSPVGRRRRGFA